MVRTGILVATLLIAPGTASAQTDSAAAPHRPRGTTIFGDPAVVPLPARDPVLAAPGALVAQTLVRLDELQWRTTAPIKLPAPFRATLYAGRMLATRTDAQGQPEICDTHPLHQTYRPFEDGEGHFYPQLCLRDRGADGGYTRVTLEPYRAEWGQRSYPIPPMRLEPAPVTEWQPTTIYAVRRLRIGAIEAGVAHLNLEDSVFLTPPEGQSIDAAIDAANYRPADSLDLPLAEGASASIGGVTVTAHREAAGWRIAAAGSFSGFTRVTENGTTVNTVKPH